MSSIDTVVRAARKIESLLEQRLGATGTGLHAKLTSVETLVPEHIGRKIRYIATLRNNIVHNDGVELDNPEAFQLACDEVVQHLDATWAASTLEGNVPKGARSSFASTFIDGFSFGAKMIGVFIAKIVAGALAIFLLWVVIPALLGLLF